MNLCDFPKSLMVFGGQCDKQAGQFSHKPGKYSQFCEKVDEWISTLFSQGKDLCFNLNFAYPR